MLRGFFSIAGLVVGGIILADIIANPAGTTAFGSQIGNIDKINSNALLGKTS